MPFTLQDVVPWGRNFDEYVNMFNLSETDFAGRILGCSDGPASFNTEATQRGYQVTSCDPLYVFDAPALKQRIDEIYPIVVDQLKQNPDQFVWKHFQDPDDLGNIRMSTMQKFLADFEKGQSEGRYVTGTLPQLPFADDSFDLALCSHFLFLYSQQFDADFHIQAIRELCRVAREVRVFPLRNLANEDSPHLEIVSTALREGVYTVTQQVVEYEFQRGGNQMLRVQQTI